nr:MAG TPA: hypothetical protein [Myoviridae sp. ctNPX13]DAN78113.1 MAG TPA: hypothetical protein [Caudoviricetes sp.]
MTSYNREYSLITVFSIFYFLKEKICYFTK